MINKVIAFIRYYIKSKTIYDIHSPYLYNLLAFCSDKERKYYDFLEIEEYRNLLKQDHSTITRTDLGAGSKYKSNQKISDITKHAISPRSQLEFLYRLILFTEPNVIIELGSSLGISTAYLSRASEGMGKVISIEGDPQVYKIAQLLFDRLKLRNLSYINNNFDHVLTELPEADLVFIDGNHNKKSTIKYCTHFANRMTNKGIIILDDITWSQDMIEAWNELKNISGFNASIDLFNMGILIKNPDIKHKIDLSFIPYHYKIWRAGFFK